MTTNISNLENIIDVRDIIERIEELEEELQAAHEEGKFMSDFSDWIASTRDNSAPVYAVFWGARGHDVVSGCEELVQLQALMAALKGAGGDEKWRGDWYPLTLIRDSYFTDAMRELCEDIGDLPRGLPPYIVIDWEATADNLRVDYSSLEFGGITYWFR